MAEILLKITQHANDKMFWFGITADQIKKVIVRGSKFKQTDGYLASHGYVNVAYKKISKNIYKIKTVYLR